MYTFDTGAEADNKKLAARESKSIFMVVKYWFTANILFIFRFLFTLPPMVFTSL
tara:strand:- start:630 stop:791 length:162 start_codon:yes stop_codon:yes gene_type:complete